MYYIDVHNHIQEKGIPADFNLLTMMTKKFAIMGTNPNDWDQIKALTETYPKQIIPGFGVHPWFSSKLKHDWELELINKLTSTKGSYIGEIGLDKTAIDYNTKTIFDFNIQLKVFKYQFQLAALLDLPCSIHIVGCHGVILDYFQLIHNDLIKAEDDTSKLHLLFPRRIMFHSYSGSGEIVKGLIKQINFSRKEKKLINFNKFKNLAYNDELKPFLKEIKLPEFLYFSLSTLVNGRIHLNKNRNWIQYVDKKGLLIESDWNDINKVDEKMLNIANLLKDILNWELNDVIKLCFENSKNFYEINEEDN